MVRPRLLPDGFTLALVATVAVASVLPAGGAVAPGFETATKVAISGLFFLHGARLSREAVVAGMTNVRLHIVILASTFALFPLLGLALRPLLEPLVTVDLYDGVLFLCALPSTVQSSIALTSIARGNVPAAVCAASASSLVGVFVSPLLVGVLLARGGGGASLESVKEIVGLLLLPFVVGQLARPLVGDFVQRHAAGVRRVDQSAILLAVYTAFSRSVNEGLWLELPPIALAGLAAICVVLLGLAFVLTRVTAKALRFPVEDEITIVLCGSKKSLATGIPMANVLFAGSAAGVVVLPLMLYHQLQLMVGAYVAQRYAARPDPDGDGDSRIRP
jgi:solute carrier family 10 (sodium/bile acid cotransporter), member 7